ncbi:D-aminoacyl-tRNA deacylase OS=Ureibacillus acetophenoni OX=614649 GN=dtd PE=3 SV=1 [Ureibacillus acetophenoni]
MRVVIQRSKRASVTVDGEVTGAIDKGYVLLVGLTHTDTIEDVKYVAKKVAEIRLWEDEEGKMNHSILEHGGDILSVSQLHYMLKQKKAEDRVSLKVQDPK